jgi:hypothetical protein
LVPWQVVDAVPLGCASANRTAVWPIRLAPVVTVGSRSERHACDWLGMSVSPPHGP